MTDIIFVPTPISTKPEKEGVYMTKWIGVPAWTEKEFLFNGGWQTRFEHTGLMIEWLCPIPASEYKREIAREAWVASENRSNWAAEPGKWHNEQPDLETYLSNL